MGLKAVLLVADGMADRPIRELDWRTPLEAADKPALNQVARTGISGMLDPIAPGIPPGSDTATLALLGYDPLKVYSGRGALEAVGSGFNVLPGDVAFRCNFATTDENGVVLDRRAGRIANEDASRLAFSLQKVKVDKSLNVRFRFQNTVEHRAVLVLHGPKLSAAVSDTDPEIVGRKALEAKPTDKTKEAERTAQIVNLLLGEFQKVLSAHSVNEERTKHGFRQANAILCRGAGTIPRIAPLGEEFGIRSACVAAVPMIRGVCKVAEMNVMDVRGATGTVNTDYGAKAKATVKALKTHDFVFLHVKATDVASHDHDAKLKIETIERVDEITRHIIENIEKEVTYVAVTADHTTSLLTGNHEGDPVPVAITGPYVRRDNISEFAERTCARGGLGRIRGADLMHTLMSLLGRAKKFGA